ncbi:hypothetical protein D3C78_1507340 [compost metagenome]
MKAYCIEKGNKYEALEIYTHSYYFFKFNNNRFADICFEKINNIKGEICQSLIKLK